MDVTAFKDLATLGIGGVLAGFMFMYYRKDVRQYTELWKAATGEFMQVVKENTASNTKLIVLIESLERNALRKVDVETLMDTKYQDGQTQRRG